MRKFKDVEYALYKQICSMSQKGLKDSLSDMIHKKYDDVIETDQYIYAIGDIPITLVAHMDTVFKFPAKEFYYDREANVVWSPDGGGADDRAGVFAILYILKSHFRPSIIFTTDEEKGCIGAEALTTDIPMALTETKYIVQLDRRGKDDCVFYDCYNQEFEKYVNHFGFKTAIGSFSDISIICPFWKIAGVNLSVGYFNEHSTAEYLNVGYLFNTITKVIRMLNDAENAKQHIYIESPWMKQYGYAYGYGSTLMDGYGPGESEMMKCGHCGHYYDEYEMFPVKTNGTMTFYCPDCIADDHIHWCKYCQDAFYAEGDEVLCPDCVKLIKGVLNENGDC